ncbi:MAG: helix-turn-helix domain-containing protein [Steroidobacteraceae bacterium]
MYAKADIPIEDMSSSDVKESTRPIRALNRGLDVLIELNRLQRAPINTLALAVNLPRTTTYRILETLRAAGYVERDRRDDCYRPTIMVCALSGGFDLEATVAQRAKPLLSALCKDIVWPLTLTTPSGPSMLVRETTDRQSPLALEQNAVGTRLPMLTTAAGRAFLAWCAPQQRDAIIDLLSRTNRPEDRLAHDRQELERLMNETRTQGFGHATRARRVSEETSIAIPVQGGNRILATLMVRFSATAVPLRSAVDQFLPRMRELVSTLERQI